MPSRTLPGIGLKGFWALGENGWKDEHDRNLLVLSVIAGGQVLDLLATLPGSPTDGQVYLLDESAGADANKLCIRDVGAWVKISPLEGAILYDVAAGFHRWFDGTTWVQLATGATGALTLKGATDCSANPNYPAAVTGDFYIVSVGGKIGGASGTTVEAGDAYFATADNAGGTEAAVGANWAKLEKNGVYGAGGTAASTTDVLNGTNAINLVTPDALAALWEQAADVASSGTTSLGEGGYFNITGTTTITDIDFATDKAGRRAWVKFAGALTLTNGANLILPSGANIVTAAGDTAEFISEGSDVVRCVAYARASGRPLKASAPSIQSIASSATVTPTFDDDQVNITAQAAGLTLANPTGTAVDGWGMSIRIKDNGTARSISYGTQYRAIGATLPTTTVISKTLYLGMIYNAADTKWDVVAVAQEA